MTDSEVKSKIISHFLNKNIDFKSACVVFLQFLKNKYFENKEDFIYTEHYDELLAELCGEEKLDFSLYIQYSNILKEIIENLGKR